jgi:hypothetical protein
MTRFLKRTITKMSRKRTPVSRVTISQSMKLIPNAITSVVRPLVFVFGAAIVAVPTFAQAPQDVERDAAAGQTNTSADKNGGDDTNTHVFGIIPNFRTSPTLTPYVPLDASTKVHLATEDAFDPGSFVLAGLFAVQAQWAQTAPSFGHGIGAYGRYYAAALTDLVVGDFMTEAIYPVALHHDPRYFRRGTGSGWTRLGYAVGQIFWAHNDRGAGAVNVSELAGNATAVAIGDAYYPDGRSFSKNLSRWSWQVGTDMASNVLKEFWPDLERAFGHHQTR